MSILLTDDDVVGIAVHVRARWEGLLPTVTPNSVTALVDAAARGHRSLVARGLASADGRTLSVELRAAIAAATGGAAISVFAASREDPIVPIGTGITVFSANDNADGVVVDIVTPTLIHEISEVSVGQARSALTNLARQAYHNGSSTSSDRVLTMVTPPAQPGAGRVLIVSPRSVVELSVNGDLHAVIDSPTSVEEFDSTLDALLQRAIGGVEATAVGSA